MAIVTRKVSDLTGAEAAEEAFATVVVRKDARLDAPVALDVLLTELGSLKEATDLVVIEIKAPGETTRELVLKKSDFDKLASNGKSMDDVLKSARGTKGRPKGSTNGNGTSA